jgi:hypothetical protein
MAAIWAETEAIHERRMAKLDAHQERTMAHQEVTESEPDPRMMQSIDKSLVNVLYIVKWTTTVITVNIQINRDQIRSQQLFTVAETLTCDNINTGYTYYS